MQNMNPMNWNNLREGEDLCDVDGNKVGTIKMIHRLGTIGGSNTEGYLHVDTGFLGLGKDLYIPFSAIRDCDNNCCYLNVPKEDIDRMGWDSKPSNLS